MSDVPVILPDGSTGTLPTKEAKNLPVGGRVLSPGEHEAALGKVRQETYDDTLPGIASNVADTLHSFQHASGAGFGEALGVPVDAAEIGVAGLFGKRAEERSREVLRGLNERHPMASAAGELGGNVAGALVGSDATGVGRALAGPGAAKVAGRMAVGGIDNVIQATTKDVNEAELGDHAVNGEMLVANMPKNFLIGSLLTGAFEGGAHVLGKGVRAVTSRAVPALEEGASRAVGRELGLAGDEALEGGARVRGLNGGEVPTSRGGLADVLAGEQGVQRARGVAEHAAAADALEGAQTTEAALLSARQEAARKSAGEAVRSGTTAAEGEAGAGIWEAAAEQDAKVGGAQASGAARVGEAKAAHAAAGEEALGAADRVLEAGAAKESGVADAIARGQQRVSQVADHFGAIHSTLESERAAALKALEEIGAEHVAATKDLQAAIRRMGDGAKPPGYVPRSAKAGSKMNYAQRAPKVGDLDVETGETYTAESLSRIAEERAANTGSAAIVAEAVRLSKLQKTIAAAREHAQTHLDSVEGAIRENSVQARRAVKVTTQETHQEIARVTSELSAPVENASKRSGHAMRAVEEAQRRVKHVEEETAAYVDKARSEGAGAVAKAEKRGAARIASAKADAEKILADFESGAAKEKGALTKTHEAAREALPGPSEKTDVDSFIKGMAEHQAKLRERPAVSGAALMGAGLSVLHGNPLAGAGALASSFAAGAARNHGNLIAARMMRGLSTTLTEIDAAVRDGATSMLTGTAAKVARSIESKPHQRQEPSFEDISAKVIDVQSNPAELEHRVREAVGHIAIDAPATYQEILATAVRANAYLYSILPLPQRDPGTLTPHLDPGYVPETERYDFMQSVRTIDDPFSIFEDVNSGTITQAQVDAIDNVYPMLFDKMRNEVKMQTMYLSSPVDYEREIHVGTLLGQVTNEVLEPDFQALMSKSYTQKLKQQTSQNAGGGGSGSKASKNLMSGSESIEGDQP